VKNRHIFNWIKKSTKSSDSKQKSNEDFSRRPTAVSYVVFDQQAKNEFIAIQIEEDESEIDEFGNKKKWVVNSNLGNEKDFDRPGPSRINKRRRSKEFPLSDMKKGDVESDDSLETV